MVKIELKGVAKVRSKGRDYYYAWRGGPRLIGEPGSPEFVASYREAHEDRRTSDDDRFRSVVIDYRGSEAFARLAPSTRKNWSPWLDRIDEHFGSLRIIQFDRRDRIRPVIMRWRNQYTATPRSADYGMQVLSRVLAHAVDPLAKIGKNPCEGIRQLYRGNRSEIIWTESDIIALKATAAPEIAHAVDLAAHTGLRLGDILRVSWSHVQEDAIVIASGKSRFRREAIIPLYGELRDVLVNIPRRSTTILTNNRHRPWTRNGFGSSFNKAKHRAGAILSNLRFHDLRGTAATRFYIAGLPMRVIAEILAWDEEHVEKIIRRYVGRSAATKAIIDQLNISKRRT